MNDQAQLEVITNYLMVNRSLHKRQVLTQHLLQRGGSLELVATALANVYGTDLDDMPQTQPLVSPKHSDAVVNTIFRGVLAVFLGPASIIYFLWLGATAFLESSDLWSGNHNIVFPTLILMAVILVASPAIVYGLVSGWKGRTVAKLFLLVGAAQALWWFSWFTPK